MTLSAWDHARAALVTIHLFAVVVGSVPPPPPLDAATLRRSANAAQLAPWEGVAARFGVAPDELRTLVIGGAGSVRAVRAAFTDVLQPYYDLFGTRQSWSMFGTINHAPGRVEIYLEEDGAWRPLHVPLLPGADWREGQLRSERMRAALNGYANGAQREAYAGFARWAAREVAGDRPGATRIKVQTVRLRVPRPEDLARDGVIPTQAPQQVIVLPVGGDP